MKQKLLLSLIALCFSIGAWADALNVNDTFTADGITYKVTSISPNEVQVGTGKYYTPVIDKSTTGAIIIPASATGTDGNSYSVTSIGKGAFWDCSGLTSVTIPNSVTSIGSNVFAGCSGLTSMIIPNSVTSIENGAFSDCSSLTSVTIPNSVTSIGDGAFNSCSGLKSVTLPNSLSSIGGWAFQNCSGLTSITIPNSVTSIGHYAFSGCIGLTSIVIPKSVTSLGGNPFIACINLTSIKVESGNENYDSIFLNGNPWRCHTLSQYLGSQSTKARLSYRD